MVERLKIGEVEIAVTFKDIKNLHLSVHPPDGHVTISSPKFYDLEKVKIYAATKMSWIKKERSKFLNQNRISPRIFKNQESHYLFGARYMLKLETDSKKTVEIKGKKIIIKSIDITDKIALNNIINSYYRKELRAYLLKRIAYYASIMDLSIPTFHIRSMKTKWGSCAFNNGRIWFNIELAKKPFSCIDYVVVHELVHLLERHHNKRFILLMDRYYPNWRTMKRLLNELPL